MKYYYLQFCINLQIILHSRIRLRFARKIATLPKGARNKTLQRVIEDLMQKSVCIIIFSTSLFGKLRPLDSNLWRTGEKKLVESNSEQIDRWKDWSCNRPRRNDSLIGTALWQFNWFVYKLAKLNIFLERSKTCI